MKMKCILYQIILAIYMAYLTSQQQHEICLQSTFIFTNQQCIKCNDNCIQCISQDLLGCTQCKAFIQQNKCVQSCSDGYFVNDQKECTPCPIPFCQQCSSYQICSKCEEGFSLKQIDDQIICVYLLNGSVYIDEKSNEKVIAEECPNNMLKTDFGYCSSSISCPTLYTSKQSEKQCFINQGDIELISINNKLIAYGHYQLKVFQMIQEEFKFEKEFIFNENIIKITQSNDTVFVILESSFVLLDNQIQSIINDIAIPDDLINSKSTQLCLNNDNNHVIIANISTDKNKCVVYNLFNKSQRNEVNLNVLILDIIYADTFLLIITEQQLLSFSVELTNDKLELVSKKQQEYQIYKYIDNFVTKEKKSDDFSYIFILEKYLIKIISLQTFDINEIYLDYYQSASYYIYIEDCPYFIASSVQNSYFEIILFEDIFKIIRKELDYYQQLIQLKINQQIISAYNFQLRQFIFVESNSSNPLLITDEQLLLKKSIPQNTPEKIIKLFNIKMENELKNVENYIFFTTKNGIFRMNNDYSYNQLLLSECIDYQQIGIREKKLVKSIVYISSMTNQKYLFTINSDSQLYCIELNEQNIIISETKIAYEEQFDEFIKQQFIEKVFSQIYTMDIYEVLEEKQLKLQFIFEEKLIIILFLKQPTFNIQKTIIYENIQIVSSTLFKANLYGNQAEQQYFYLSNGKFDYSNDINQSYNNDKYFIQLDLENYIIQVIDINNQAASYNITMEQEDSQTSYGNFGIYDSNLVFASSISVKIYDLVTKKILRQQYVQFSVIQIFFYIEFDTIILNSRLENDNLQLNLYSFSTLEKTQSLIYYNMTGILLQLIQFKNFKGEQIFMLSDYQIITDETPDFSSYILETSSNYILDQSQQPIQITQLPDFRYVIFNSPAVGKNLLLNGYYKDLDAFNFYSALYQDNKIQMTFSTLDEQSYFNMQSYIKQNNYWILNNEIYPNFFKQINFAQYPFSHKVISMQLIEPSYLFTFQKSKESEEYIEIIKYVNNNIIFTYSFISRCSLITPFIHYQLNKLVLCDESKFILIDLDTFQNKLNNQQIPQSDLVFVSKNQPLVLFNNLGIYNYELDTFTQLSITFGSGDYDQIIENNSHILFYLATSPNQITSFDLKNYSLNIQYLGIDTNKAYKVFVYKQFIILLTQKQSLSKVFYRLQIFDISFNLLKTFSESSLNKKFKTISHIMYENINYAIIQFTESFQIYQIIDKQLSFIYEYSYNNYYFINLNLEYFVVAKKIDRKSTFEFISIIDFQIIKSYTIENSQYQPLMNYMMTQQKFDIENISNIKQKSIFIYYQYIFSLVGNMILTFQSDQILYDSSTDFGILTDFLVDGSQFYQLLDYSQLFPLDLSKSTYYYQEYPQTVIINAIKYQSSDTTLSTFIFFFDHKENKFNLFDTSNSSTYSQSFIGDSLPKYQYQNIIQMNSQQQPNSIKDIHFIAIFKNLIIHFTFDSQNIVLELNSEDYIIQNTQANWQSFLLKNRNKLYQLSFQQQNNKYILDKQQLSAQTDYLISVVSFNGNYICYLDEEFNLFMIYQSNTIQKQLTAQIINLFEIYKIENTYILAVGTKEKLWIYNIITGLEIRSFSGYFDFVRKMLIDEELKYIYIFDLHYCYIYKYTNFVDDALLLFKFQIQTRGSFKVQKLNKNLLAIMAYSNVFIHYIGDTQQLVYKIINKQFANVNQIYLVENDYLIAADYRRIYIYNIQSEIKQQKLIKTFDISSVEIKSYKIYTQNEKELLEIYGVNYEQVIKLNIELKNNSKNRYQFPSQIANVYQAEQYINQNPSSQQYQFSSFLQYSPKQIILNIQKDNQIIVLPEHTDIKGNQSIQTYLIYDLSSKKALITGQMVQNGVVVFSNDQVKELTFQNGYLENPSSEMQKIKFIGLEKIIFKNLNLESYQLYFENVQNIYFEDVQFHGSNNIIRINSENSQLFKTSIFKFINCNLNNQFFNNNFLVAYQVDSLEIINLNLILDFTQAINQEYKDNLGFFHIQNSINISLKTITIQAEQFMNKFISVVHSQTLNIDTIKITNSKKRRLLNADQIPISNQLSDNLTSSQQNSKIERGLIDLTYIRNNVSILNINIEDIVLYQIIKIQDYYYSSQNQQDLQKAVNLKVVLNNINSKNIQNYDPSSVQAVIDIIANNIQIDQINFQLASNFGSIINISDSQYSQIDGCQFDGINNQKQIIYLSAITTSLLSNIRIDNSFNIGSYLQIEETPVQINDLLINTKEFNFDQLKISTFNSALFIKFQKGNTLQTPVVIQNSKLYKIINKSSNGAALRLENIPSIQLINTILSENQSNTNGGALSAENTNLQFDGIQINQNIAKLSGGALYLEESTVKIQDSLIDANGNLIKTQIKDNSALIGGAIRYFNSQPLNFVQSNSDILSGNKARLYGQTYAMYPKQVVLINPKENEIIKAVSSIAKHQNKIQFYWLDEEGQQLKFNYSDLQTEDEYNSIVTEMDQYYKFVDLISDKISFNTILNLYQTSASLQVNEEGGYYFELNISLLFKPEDSADFYLNFPLGLLKSNYIPSIQRKTRHVTVQFRKCYAGEVFNRYNAQFYECFKCESNTYSLFEPKDFSQTCKECSSDAIKCEGDIIIVKDGYWKELDYITYCKYAPNRCIINNERYQTCSEGAFGPRCESCDYFNKYWQQGIFGKSEKYDCITCDDQRTSSLQIMRLFFIMIAQSFFITYISIILINNIHAVLLGRFFRAAGIVNLSTSLSQKQFITFIKFFINYLQILNILLQINFPIATWISNIINFFGNPLLITKYQLDCFFLKEKYIDSLNMVSLRFLWVIISFYIYFLILIIVIFIYAYIKKRKIENKVVRRNCYIRYIKIAASYIFYLFYPNLVQVLIEVISCQRIGIKSYSYSDSQFECYTKEHITTMVICSVLLFFLVICFPFYIFKLLKRNANKFNSIHLYSYFSFYYSEYENKYYYWELLRMIQKALIYIVDNLANESYIHRITLVTICMIIYLRLLQISKPYKNQVFQKLDQYTNLFLLIQYQIGLASISSQSEIKIQFSQALIIILNLILIYLILQLISQMSYKISNNSIIYKFIELKLKRYKIFRNMFPNQQNFFKSHKAWVQIRKYIKEKEIIKESIIEKDSSLNKITSKTDNLAQSNQQGGLVSQKSIEQQQNEKN